MRVSSVDDQKDLSERDGCSLRNTRQTRAQPIQQRLSQALDGQRALRSIAPSGRGRSVSWVVVDDGLNERAKEVSEVVPETKRERTTRQSSGRVSLDCAGLTSRVDERTESKLWCKE